MGSGGGSSSNNNQNVGVVENTVSSEVEIFFLPTLRQREVRFRARGLLPNTRHYPFFDGVRVDKYCYPIPFEIGDNWRHAFRNNWDPANRVPADLTSVYSAIYEPLNPEDWNNTWNPLYGNVEPVPNDTGDWDGKLISDANGVIEGVFFLPNNPEISFEAGKRRFSLYDITAEDDATSASRAKATYTGQGILETTTEVIEVITTEQLPPPPRPRRERDDPPPRDTGGRKDPVAQSFYVSNKEGMFLTKVGVYFKTKDTNNIPVQLQIRPMSNGYPAAYEFLPGTSTFKYPADISVSDDASAVTVFTLDQPTYLQPNEEYAIVLITPSLEYDLWISRMGEFAIGETDRKITTQPNLGSLFISQNSNTWEPSQFEDMKFILYRAVFSASGEAIIENEGTQKKLLPADPFIFDSGSTSVRVIHPNHGFVANDIVSFRGPDSATDFPMRWASLQGDQTITSVDYTGYTFTADSAATATGRYGGTNVKTQDQVMMNYLVPSINSVALPNTTLVWDGKFTSGRSIGAGTAGETAYAKDASYSDPFQPFDNITFDNPALIASYENEVSQMGGARSATIRARLSTTNDYVSPIINAERMSLTAVHNVIDNQDSAATSGFNVPLTFVNETDPTLGSAIAKHVTIPIVLENEAVGLKILLSAHKRQEANFSVYYKAVLDDEDLEQVNWTLIEPETIPAPATNDTSFADYEYLAGGLTGTLTPFTKFQLKIVMGTTNTSRPPRFKDLRIIALTV